MASNPPLIAVVDDDAPVRTSLRRLLRSSGFAVEAYDSGDAFLEALPADGVPGVPDCLVLDLHMPGRSGFDVQSALTAARRTIPVIVITGKEEAGTADLARAAGAAAFLTKPVEESALLGAVRNSISGRPAS